MTQAVKLMVKPHGLPHTANQTHKSLSILKYIQPAMIHFVTPDPSNKTQLSKIRHKNE